jgi:hypothetical protein
MIRFSNSVPTSNIVVIKSRVVGRNIRRPKVLSASEYTASKTAVGVTSNAYDVALSPGMPDSNVDLGLLYSNGYRYQYIKYKATTAGCSEEIPDKIITVQEQTDAGLIVYDQTVSGYTLVKAYVGNSIVVPQQPNPNVVTIGFTPPSKVEPQLTNNNNC